MQTERYIRRLCKRRTATESSQSFGKREWGLLPNRAPALWKVAKARELTQAVSGDSRTIRLRGRVICHSENDLSASTTDGRPDIKCLGVAFILHFRRHNVLNRRAPHIPVRKSIVRFRAIGGKRHSSFDVECRMSRVPIIQG